jgi:pyridoxal phosphate enzyme (YggS family)
MNKDQLGQRLARVRAQIEAAALQCGRLPHEVTLIAISKTHPASLVRTAIELGATDVGENRVQEAEQKINEVGRHATRWHLVGHLQANKARRAVQLFDVIHSLDSLELARRLDRLCGEEGRENLSVLIQVDLGHEETKTGIDQGKLKELVESLKELERIQLVGLMTLPPFFGRSGTGASILSQVARVARRACGARFVWRWKGRTLDGHDARFRSRN